MTTHSENLPLSFRYHQIHAIHTYTIVLNKYLSEFRILSHSDNILLTVTSLEQEKCKLPKSSMNWFLFSLHTAKATKYEQLTSLKQTINKSTSWKVINMYIQVMNDTLELSAPASCSRWYVDIDGWPKTEQLPKSYKKNSELKQDYLFCATWVYEWTKMPWTLLICAKKWILCAERISK